jgi:hypothetical protein
LREARPHIRWFGAHRVFAGEKTARHDPIGIGQGPIWPRAGSILRSHLSDVSSESTQSSSLKAFKCLGSCRLQMVTLAISDWALSTPMVL